MDFLDDDFEFDAGDVGPPRIARMSVRGVQEAVMEGRAGRLKAWLAALEEAAGDDGPAANADWDRLSKAVLQGALDIVEGRYTAVLASPAGEAVLGEGADAEDFGSDSAASLPRTRAFLQARAADWVCGALGEASCPSADEGALEVPEELAAGGDWEAGDCEAPVLRALLLQWLAVACLDLFLQANWTGPSLSDEATAAVSPLGFQRAAFPAGAAAAAGGSEESKGADAPADDEPASEDDVVLSALGKPPSRTPLARAAARALCVDGEEAVERAEVAHLLVVARALLEALTNPLASRPLSGSMPETLAEVAPHLVGAAWWCGRAAVVHQQTIADRKSAGTLVALSTEMLRRVAAVYCPAQLELFAAPKKWTPDEDGADEGESLFREAARRAATTSSLLASQAAEAGSEASGAAEAAEVAAGGAGAAESRGSAAPTPAEAEAAAADGRTSNGIRDRLAARLLVEWGVAQCVFVNTPGAKAAFYSAKGVSGLKASLTGVLGRRTKFQKRDLSQLVLIASSRPDSGAAADAAAGADESPDAGDSAGPSGDTGGAAAGTANTADAADAADAAGPSEGADAARAATAGVKTLTLDEVDADNVLLEQIRFVDDGSDASGKAKLTELDQTVVLGLCQDVKNSNPSDGLTAEQMEPYCARVLQQPQNWMVYTTGLLVKSTIEFETTRKMERAVLQLQALVDQHGTRMTFTQNSSETIANDAPACDRLRHIHSLNFPPYWELKRQLGERYLRMGVLRSALKLFEELECWDEAIACLTLLEKPKRAEALLRARLSVEETPKLLALLGDVTNDPEMYERAWELSGGTYARAKRSLGERAFSKGDMEAAIEHFQEALAVNAGLVQTWFLMGCACMQLEKHKLGVRAFSRVVQQQSDMTEAWANLASIFMAAGKFDLGFAALERALHNNKRNWKVWSNYILAAVRSRHYSGAINGMHQLLELRVKEDRAQALDTHSLALLVTAVTASLAFAERHGDASGNASGDAAAATAKADPAPSTDDPALDDPDAENAGDNARDGGAEGALFPELPVTVEDEEEDGADAAAVSATASGVEGDDDEDHLDAYGNPARLQAPALTKLFGRITASVTRVPEVWHLYAVLNDALGRTDKTEDCMMKECRALQRAEWERSERGVARVCRCAGALAKRMLAKGDKRSLASARMLARGVLHKAKTVHGELPEVAALQELQDSVAAAEAALGGGAAPAEAGDA